MDRRSGRRCKRDEALARAGLRGVPRAASTVHSQEAMNPIHKEALCIMCGCCVSECNSMEADPEFLGPAALAKGFRFVGDPRDRNEGRAARALQLRARDLGLHALLLLQRALPEGRRPARRDREARRRVDQGGHRPRHGREAREVVRPLGRDDRLAPRDRARAEDAGRHRGDQADEVRDLARQAGQGAAARSRRTWPKDVGEARALRELVQTQGRDGAAGHVQGERALARIEHTDAGSARRDAPEVTPGEEPPRAEG